MSVPKDLKYTRTHEWIRVEGNVAVSGITDHAVKMLSDLVYVDLPELGDLTEKGHPYATVESVKAAEEINAPISGEIETVNEALIDSLETLSKDPYGAGWLAKIKISYPDELGTLLSPEDYEKLLAAAPEHGKH
jgi:glycine cleavage system H protein